MLVAAVSLSRIRGCLVTQMNLEPKGTLLQLPGAILMRAAMSVAGGMSTGFVVIEGKSVGKFIADDNSTATPAVKLEGLGELYIDNITAAKRPFPPTGPQPVAGDVLDAGGNAGGKRFACMAVSLPDSDTIFGYLHLDDTPGLMVQNVSDRIHLGRLVFRPS